MERIDSNGWFIKENEMSRALMRFHVRIRPFIEKGKLMALLTVNDGNMSTLVFRFDNMEEAISFIMNSINACKELVEIPEKHREFLEAKKDKPKQKVYYDKKRID